MSWCLLLIVPALEKRNYYVTLRARYFLHSPFLPTLHASTPITSESPRLRRWGRPFQYHNGLIVTMVVLFSWHESSAAFGVWKSWLGHEEVAYLSCYFSFKAFWESYGSWILLWFSIICWTPLCTEHDTDIWWAIHGVWKGDAPEIGESPPEKVVNRDSVKHDMRFVRASVCAMHYINDGR